jgi:hypothetical protein
MTLACEPTGHRRKVVDELALQAGIELVCAQPLLVHRAREGEDFTRDKSDDKDALLIPNVIVRLPSSLRRSWQEAALTRGGS